MSAPPDLALSSQIIRESEAVVERQRELIDLIRKEGQCIDDAAVAFMLMEAAVELMGLQHSVAVAAIAIVQAADLSTADSWPLQGAD